MRIFNAFLIIFGAVILFLLPLTAAVYAYRTDLRTDTFLTATAVGVTSANESLLEDLYDDDIGSIDIDSDDATDTPLPNSYNATSRVVNVIGLTGNTTRTLDISYDVDALEGNDALNVLADRLPWIWLLMIIAFAPAAMVALFLNRA